MTNIEVFDEDIGKRLDVFVSEREDITRAFAQKLIEDGGVLVLGAKKNKNYKIRKADEISIEYPPPRECEAAAEDIPVDIVYEDEDIIVVNKPRGMTVHVGNGNEIDIVACIANTVVFVEVKTRSIGSQSQKEPRPASSVTPEKQRKIIKASSEFMRSRRLNKRMRYDVIEVYLENGEKKKRVKEIKHLVSTFDITTAFCRQFSNNN